MEKYLTVKQAADILSVSPETLRRWDNSGKFKSLRHPINNYRAYSEEQLQNLVEEMQLQIEYTLNKDVSVSIEPFFSTQYGELFNYDAIKFLKQLETNSVDLIFADPPYNIKKAEWTPFQVKRNMLNGVWHGLQKLTEFLKIPALYTFVVFLKY